MPLPARLVLLRAAVVVERDEVRRRSCRAALPRWTVDLPQYVPTSSHRPAGACSAAAQQGLALVGGQEALGRARRRRTGRGTAARGSLRGSTGRQRVAFRRRRRGVSPRDRVVSTAPAPAPAGREPGAVGPAGPADPGGAGGRDLRWSARAPPEELPLDVSPTIWLVTIGAIVLVLGIDLLIAARKGPHVIGVGEATRWVLFYVTLAVLFGIGLCGRSPAGRPSARVLRRLPDRVLAVGRQPVRLRDHHGELPGAAGAPAQGAAVRHRAGAGPARRASSRSARRSSRRSSASSSCSARSSSTPRSSWRGTATRSRRSATTRCSSSWRRSCRPRASTTARRS